MTKPLDQVLGLCGQLEAGVQSAVICVVTKDGQVVARCAGVPIAWVTLCEVLRVQVDKRFEANCGIASGPNHPDRPASETT